MRFADFHIDPDAGVLMRAGQRIRLQDLPFRLLVALARRPGAVVTRDELRAELWGAETFVDAEAGLNTAVAKLREALGDDAEAPRFIETLPKRGYRFVGTLVSDDVLALAEPAVRRRRWPFVAVLAVLATTAAVVTFWPTPATTIAVVRFHNETGQADLDRLAGTLTDAVVVALAGDTRYAVIGNDPVLRTDRMFQDVRRIGDALDAQFVVLGQVQQGDRGLIVRAHFIRVRDEAHLWATTIPASEPEIEQRVTRAVASGVAAGLERAARQQP